MLDEPSLGLAPNVVQSVFEQVVRINREAGVTILIVEQKVREVLAISQRVYSLKLGRVAFGGLRRGVAGRDRDTAGPLPIAEVDRCHKVGNGVLRRLGHGARKHARRARGLYV